MEKPSAFQRRTFLSMCNFRLQKIVSGAQTGVDRAALDAALELSIPCGGWCPADRSAEDGTISTRYPVQALSSGGRRKRTEWNVRDSDGTLILVKGSLTGGSLLTHNLADKYGRPCLVVELDGTSTSHDVVKWITHRRIQTLNVAGPSESRCPGIYGHAFRFLHDLLSQAGSES